jgi:S-adenosyl methyltransferase
VGIDVTRPGIARVCDYWLGGMDNYEDGRRFAERLLAVVPDAQAAARASKSFLARAVGFLIQEAGIRQVRCRDSGRSGRARLGGPRAGAGTAMDPGLWCDVTKDPYLSCARAWLD